MRYVGYVFGGFFALLFLLVVIVPLSADFGLWRQEIRYRVTLEIDTPDGVKRGSSVIGVRRIDPPGVVSLGLGLRWLFAGGGSHPIRYFGDAPFVDLGGGKNVIMLIGKGFAWESAPFEFLGIQRRAIGDLRQRGDWRFAEMIEDIWAGRVLPPEKAEIADTTETKPDYGAPANLPESAPFLITFRDIGDSASAAVLYTLDPAREFAGLNDPRRKFEEVFGPGYAYRRATVEFLAPGTPVTRGIHSRFPWWDKPVAWLAKNQVGYYADRRAPEAQFWNYRNLSTREGTRSGSFNEWSFRYDGISDYGDRKGNSP